MKLPDFLDWPLLNNLRHHMAAPLAEAFGRQHRMKEIELPVVTRLQENGIDVGLEEIQILSDKTLAYRGHRVLLYIRDVSNYGGKQELPKFHLTFCKTLDSMRQKRRFERYVVANRDDGHFQVNLIGQPVVSKMAMLNVCQLCLAHIRWQDFHMGMAQDVRLGRVRQFELKAFFKTYPKDLNAVRPAHTSDTAPLNDYPADWQDIALAVKKNRGYSCNKCRVHLNGVMAQYLHLHHRNGVKSDNVDENLELLCIRCHAEEPFHGHMKSLPSYQEYLKARH